MSIVSLIEYIFCLSEFLRCLTIYDYFVTVVSLELGTGHQLQEGVLQNGVKRSCGGRALVLKYNSYLF